MIMSRRRRFRRLRRFGLSGFFVLASAAIVLLPLWMSITGSFMGEREISDNIGVIILGGQKQATWSVFPKYPTLKPYIELLLDSPEFFAMFWNSVKQVVPAILGQLLIAVPASWGFGRFHFPGKKLLFTIYTILMIMPFQVTMVSSYLVLNQLKLLDTHWSLILPAVFSTFPVFILVKFFSSVPVSLIEAAQLDGAGEWKIFTRVGLPLGRSGIIAIVVLNFLEYWNAIEQPITFLKDPVRFPLSLYLPNITAENLGISMGASIIMMLPALLVFLYGQTYLEQGIRASGIKE